MGENPEHASYGIVYHAESGRLKVLNAFHYRVRIEREVGTKGNPENFLWIYDLNREQVRAHLEGRLQIRLGIPRALVNIVKSEHPRYALVSREDTGEVSVMTVEEYHKRNTAAIIDTKSAEDYFLLRPLKPEEAEAHDEGRLKITSQGRGMDPLVEIVKKS